MVNLGQAMQAYSVPCLLVGWWLWRAGCISQDTYLLYNCFFQMQFVFLQIGFVFLQIELVFLQNG